MTKILFYLCEDVLSHFYFVYAFKFFVWTATDVYPITTVEKVIKYIDVNKMTAGSFTVENKLCIF